MDRTLEFIELVCLNQMSPTDAAEYLGMTADEMKQVKDLVGDVIEEEKEDLVEAFSKRLDEFEKAMDRRLKRIAEVIDQQKMQFTELTYAIDTLAERMAGDVTHKIDPKIRMAGLDGKATVVTFGRKPKD